MVTRKYLCAAPHPTTWEERANSLLKSLGDDPMKREQALRQTLTLLTASRPPEKKKSGPGRKSNAEHAINFYKFALEQNESYEARSKEALKSPGRATKRRRTNEESEESDDDDDNNTTSSKMSSINTEDFMEQHNDLCEVCNVGGELLCCNTCNLVFHMACTRPLLQKIPSDKWSCSYCVASGLTGHKRESKARRRAAAACRQMDRMRDEKQQARVVPDKGAEEEIMAVEPEKPESESEGTQEGGSENLKSEEANAEATKTEEAQENVESSENDESNTDRVTVLLSPEMMTEEESIRRARRERRPPTIYDPQICAASSWQSDGVVEWKFLEKEGSKDNSDGEGKDGVEPSNGDDAINTEETKSSDGPTWCSFCKDDPSIPLCCFCACRVCFGKHSGDKLLLCDKCDQEYHTFCLDPPLVSVPASKKWFCPSCKAAKAKAEASPPKRTRKQGKKSPGRPKSTSPPEPAVRYHVRGPDGKFISKPSPRGRKPKPKKASTTASLAKSKSKGGTQKRRGRPPGSKKTPASSSRKQSPGLSTSVKSSSKSGIVKAAGRQGAIASVSSGRVLAASSSSSLASKKGGQGSFSVSQNTKGAFGVDGMKGLVSTGNSAGSFPVAAVGSKYLPFKGHPTKESGANGATAEGSTMIDSGFVPAPPPPQKSRSGRTVKRNSFHDEVYEGEQHLKAMKLKASAADASSKMTEESMRQQQMGDRQKDTYVAGTRSPLSSALNPLTSSAQIQPTPSGPPVVASVSAMVAGNSSTAKTAPDLLGTPSVSAAKSTSPHSAFSSNSTIAAIPNQSTTAPNAGGASNSGTPAKVPRRKPGARECMQISRRFGVQPVPQKYMDILMDYCTRGKVEHLIRMRERLDDHSRFLESQLAGLEALVKEKGELDITVPPVAAEGTDLTGPSVQEP